MHQDSLLDENIFGLVGEHMTQFFILPSSASIILRSVQIELKYIRHLAFKLYTRKCLEKSVFLTKIGKYLEFPIVKMVFSKLVRPSQLN